MGRNEIKLRQQLLTGNIQRYRNYAALIKKHERSKRLTRNARFFIYSLLVTVVVVLFLVIVSYLVVRLEKKQEQNKKQERAGHLQRSHCGRGTRARLRQGFGGQAAIPYSKGV